jgi:hypothetical protein
MVAKHHIATFTSMDINDMTMDVDDEEENGDKGEGHGADDGVGYDHVDYDVGYDYGCDEVDGDVEMDVDYLQKLVNRCENTRVWRVRKERQRKR